MRRLDPKRLRSGPEADPGDLGPQDFVPVAQIYAGQRLDTPSLAGYSTSLLRRRRAPT
jgi:hypothetical protein